MAEAGWPTAEVVVWAGIMAPAGVPRTIDAQARARLHRCRRWQPKCATGWSSSAPTRSGSGAKAFAEVLEKDLALWQRVALASGVKVE